MVADTAWAASSAGQRLRVKEFADGAVIFDPFTGETQLLPPLAGHLLVSVRAEPGYSHCELLQSLQDPDDDEAQRLALSAHIDDAARLLVDAGLITPC